MPKKRHSVMLTMGLVLCAKCLAASAQPAEQKLTMNDLPPAVRKAVEQETKGATIRGIAKESDKGRVQYEVETTIDGHSRDLLLDQTGQVLEIEEEAALASLPPAVSKSLGQHRTILRVETITIPKSGKVSYEATIDKAGKKSEVMVSADGKVRKANLASTQ